MTYLISTIPIFEDVAADVKFFDLNDISRFCVDVSKLHGVPPNACGKKMERPLEGKDNQGMEWVIRRRDLLKWVSDQIPAAKPALQKICRLYAADFSCLPFDVPECKGL